MEKGSQEANQIIIKPFCENIIKQNLLDEYGIGVVRRSLETNRLYNDNFFLGSDVLPSNSIDAIITDPPYNIAGTAPITKVGNKLMNTKKAWGEQFDDAMDKETYADFMEKFSAIAYRVLKPGGTLITFYDRNNPQTLSPFYARFKFKNMLAFIKNNPVPHPEGNYRSGFEMAVWFVKDGGKMTFNYLNQETMINVFYGNIGSEKETAHPTEKYQWMIEPLIIRHTNPDDVVLDPFMGSGTTPYVAKRWQRRYIGFEIVPRFYDIAVKRLEKVEGTYRLSDF